MSAALLLSFIPPTHQPHCRTLVETRFSWRGPESDMQSASDPSRRPIHFQMRLQIKRRPHLLPQLHVPFCDCLPAPRDVSIEVARVCRGAEGLEHDPCHLRETIVQSFSKLSRIGSIKSGRAKSSGSRCLRPSLVVLTFRSLLLFTKGSDK